MKTWTEWETVRHRVAVGGLVTCDGRPLVKILAEISPVNENVKEPVKEHIEKIGDDADLYYEFKSVGTKYNGYYYALDLAPGWYILRFSNSDKSEKWNMFAVQIPKKKTKGQAIKWNNIEMSCST